MEALPISKMFEQFGDFFVQKDTHNSVFLEFFYIDPEVVPSKTVPELI